MRFQRLAVGDPSEADVAGGPLTSLGPRESRRGPLVPRTCLAEHLPGAGPRHVAPRAGRRPPTSRLRALRARDGRLDADACPFSLQFSRAARSSPACPAQERTVSTAPSRGLCRSPRARPISPRRGCWVSSCHDRPWHSHRLVPCLFLCVSVLTHDAAVGEATSLGTRWQRSRTHPGLSQDGRARLGWRTLPRVSALARGHPGPVHAGPAAATGTGLGADSDRGGAESASPVSPGEGADGGWVPEPGVCGRSRGEADVGARGMEEAGKATGESIR